MKTSYPILAALLLLAGPLGFATARAAESYDNCTDFIDAVPATIGTQGVWCLRHDLSTNISVGAAITIGTNNVTIDCNGFKLGGLAAGDASQAYGIDAENRQNATVRRCNVRGFIIGIHLAGAGSAGALLEDNRLDNNLAYGIWVVGDHNRIRHNAVYATGGATEGTIAEGIYAAADISDNIVDGVFIDGGTGVAGIDAVGAGTRITGNRVGNLQRNGGGGLALGIAVEGSPQAVVGNSVFSGTETGGYGILVTGAALCARNLVTGFDTALDGCEIGTDAAGNMPY